MKRLTIKQRHLLALEVYDFAIHQFESFRQNNIGADLAYLMGAILTPEEGSFIDWTDAEEAGPLKAAMEEHFSANHSVWHFAKVR